MAKHKTIRKQPARRTTKTAKKSTPVNRAAPPRSDPAPAKAGAQPTTALRRWLPTKAELSALYQRYTNGAAFDDHDKAFFFVLDVGGVSRARQLIAHVEEVLAELEEFRG
jgi:hypothetical protein